MSCKYTSFRELEDAIAAVHDAAAGDDGRRVTAGVMRILRSLMTMAGRSPPDNNVWALPWDFLFLATTDALDKGICFDPMADYGFLALTGSPVVGGVTLLSPNWNSCQPAAQILFRLHTNVAGR